MSRWRSEPPLRIALGAGAVIWRSASEAGVARLQGRALADASAGTLTTALADAPLVEGGRRRRVEVLVGASLAVHWLQAPAHGVASLRELRAVAAARCAQLFGGDASGWDVTGDWHATGPFLCAAVPATWSAAIREALAGHRFEVGTGFGAALHSLRGRVGGGDVLVLRAGARMLLLSSAGRGWRGVRPYRTMTETGRTPDGATRDALVHAELRRWSLREGWAAPARIRWIEFEGGPAPAGLPLDDAAHVLGAPGVTRDERLSA